MPLSSFTNTTLSVNEEVAVQYNAFATFPGITGIFSI